MSRKPAPEIAAMMAISKLMDPLSGDARWRILAYFQSLYAETPLDMRRMADESEPDRTP